MRILISSGATREMIDEIRFISNVSSGSTGAYLADMFFKAGHEVVYLHGKESKLPEMSAIKKVDFNDFNSLNNKFATLLREIEFDCVIHCAAVSDYRIEKISINGVSVDKVNKLASNQDIILKLKPNFKILSQLKEYADYPFFLVGFKLTNQFSVSEEQNAIQKLFKDSEVDIVVHNDYSKINEKSHVFKIIDKELKILAEGSSKENMFECLEQKIPGSKL
jgi:phosphopantothenoylcysteine synthetase/decarboxylase